MGLFGNFNQVQRVKVNMEISNTVANDISAKVTQIVKELSGVKNIITNSLNISATRCIISGNVFIQEGSIDFSQFNQVSDLNKISIAQELNAQIKNENKATIGSIVETAGDAAYKAIAAWIPGSSKIINEKEFKSKIANEIRASTSFQMLSVTDINNWTEDKLVQSLNLVCQDSQILNNTMIQTAKVSVLIQNFNNFVTDFASKSSTIADVYNKMDLYYKEHTDFGDAVGQLKWILLAVAGVILSIAVVAVIVLLIIGRVVSAPGAALASLKKAA